MLPSKKILLVIVLFILGIMALAWYAYEKGSRIEFINAPASVGLTVASSSNPDTTVNSYQKLPGWQDSIKNSDNTKNTSNISTATETLTPTDVFARDFFNQYLKINQSGANITADNADQVASDYLKSAPLPTINAKKYTVNDLVTTDSNSATMRNYQSKITAVFTKYWPTGSSNEMLILKQTFSDNNPTALDRLAGTISIYENALKGSLTVSVPKTAVTQHLAVINTLNIYIQTLKMIQLAYTDPISGLVGLNAFLTNQANLTNSMANLRIFLINSTT